MLQKVDHVGIVVAGLESAKDFFVALGFRVVRGGPLQGQHYFSGIEGIILELAEYL